MNKEENDSNCDRSRLQQPPNNSEPGNLQGNSNVQVTVMENLDQYLTIFKGLCETGVKTPKILTIFMGLYLSNYYGKCGSIVDCFQAEFSLTWWGEKLPKFCFSWKQNKQKTR